MEYFFFFRILSWLFWPIFIIGIIIFFLRRRKKAVGSITSQKNWYLQVALSKEDALSQFFFLLGLFFFGVTLIALNREFGDPLSWKVITLITSVAGLACAYYYHLLYSLAFSLIGLISWWTAQAATWVDKKDLSTAGVVTGLCIIALILYLIGRSYEQKEKFKRFSMVYTLLGLLSVTIALFMFSTRAGIGMLEEITRGLSFVGSWEISFSLLIITLGFVALLIYAAVKRFVGMTELVAIVILFLLFSSLAFLPEQNLYLSKTSGYYSYSNSSELNSSGIVWAVAFNFVIFFELVGLILLGYAKKETWLVNLGAIFLFLLIIIKYFDWFFTFLDKSVFFITAGVLLLVVGYIMEKGRRIMIEKIKQEPAA